MKNLFINFLRHYLEIPQKPKKIVCIGGGTGLSNLLGGLRRFNLDICAVVTMCDEGGSTGRLRKLYDVPAVGDLRKCLAALASTDQTLVDLLNYRFEGNRYSKDNQLGGHSFGNLFLVALSDISGNFNKGLEEASKLLNISGKVLPSTLTDSKIWAEMTDGQKVYGEENIDLGTYQGKSQIKKLYLEPLDAKGYPKAINEILEASQIIVGPGDLYTSILPNLLIKDIAKAVKNSRASKIFITNVANKPTETKDYTIEKYLEVILDHVGFNIFDTILVNTKYSVNLPKELGYSQVKFKDKNKIKNMRIIEGDFIHSKNPTHHDANKTAEAIFNLINN
ncbi:MAG TPA: gluconeogenesis factor YvcK family protein [Patescibacteria group bacterium]